MITLLRIKSSFKTLINARLEIDASGDIWFYPEKKGVEKIKYINDTTLVN